jgi:hypothetical protein
MSRSHRVEEQYSAYCHQDTRSSDKTVVANARIRAYCLPTRRYRPHVLGGAVERAYCLLLLCTANWPGLRHCSDERVGPVAASADFIFETISP